jgi:peptidoglycan/LPS O-acetylase OafA/YrhL
MFLAAPVLHRGTAQMITERASPRWAYPLFLQNLLVPDPTGAVGPLGVTWSLAIEEQFYLVWPWIVRLTTRDQLKRIAVAVICVSPFLRLLLAHHVILYSNTFSRLDGLMVGALLAILSRSEKFQPSHFLRYAWPAGLSALLLAFVLESLNERWIVFSLSAIASGCLVFLALYSSREWFQSLLTNKFIVYTGTISYGLYLLHKLPFDFVKGAAITWHPAIVAPILLACCYGIAALSWTVLEKPFLKLKRAFESAAPTLESGDSQVVAAGRVR